MKNLENIASNELIQEIQRRFLERESTIKDMNIKPEKQGLCANVIIDGKIMYTNLKNMNKDKKWLVQELKIKGYKTFENILLAILDNNEKVTVYEKNNDIEPLVILE